MSRRADTIYCSHTHNNSPIQTFIFDTRTPHTHTYKHGFWLRRLLEGVRAPELILPSYGAKAFNFPDKHEKLRVRGSSRVGNTPLTRRYV